MSSVLVEFIARLRDEEWMEQAKCRGMGPDIFFPKRGTPPTAGKAVCAVCPVRADCDDYRRRTRSHYGIWGGKMHQKIGTSAAEERIETGSLQAQSPASETSPDPDATQVPVSVISTGVRIMSGPVESRVPGENAAAVG